jgi:hypothetical protein
MQKKHRMNPYLKKNMYPFDRVKTFFPPSNTYAINNLAILLLLPGSLLFCSGSGCKNSPAVVNATVVDLIQINLL